MKMRLLLLLLLLLMGLLHAMRRIDGVKTEK
jgi:hypothetical protein